VPLRWVKPSVRLAQPADSLGLVSVGCTHPTAPFPAVRIASNGWALAGVEDDAKSDERPLSATAMLDSPADE
jgi:hypothetical protein